jgi:hypothetical protein
VKHSAASIPRDLSPERMRAAENTAAERLRRDPTTRVAAIAVLLDAGYSAQQAWKAVARLAASLGKPS